MALNSCMHNIATSEERFLTEKRHTHYLALVDDLFKIMMLEVERDCAQEIRDMYKEMETNTRGYYQRYELSHKDLFTRLSQKYPKLFTTMWGKYQVYVDFSERDMLLRAIREQIATSDHLNKLQGVTVISPYVMSFNGEL